MLRGGKVHPHYFSEDAFKMLKGDNKKLLIIPGTSHADLYDRIDRTPIGKIEAFFEMNLK